MKYIPYISIFLLLFYTFSIFYKSDSSFDQDLGRHLKLGEIIVDTHEVPKINLFSYTNPNFPFINHHFLFEVFIYLWNQIFNLQSLLYLKIFLALTSVSLIFAAIKKSNYPLLLPLGYLFLHVLRERTDLRPEIFSYLFLSLTFFILEKFSEKKTKLIFFLPFIQFFWVNSHIYFFLGIILQGIYLINFLFKKEFVKFKLLILIFFISFLVCIFNPNYLDGLFYPLRVFNNYGYTIAENQSIFLLESIGFSDNNFIFVKICSLIVIFSIIVSFLNKTFSVKNILVALLGLTMALINIRSFPLLFFLCFPIAMQNLNINKYSKKVIFLIFISGIFLLVESILYINGDYYKNTDVNDENKIILKENVKFAMDFVISNNLPQPIYNNFDIGSYIIYRGYPKYKVFVDGRPESYPESFFQETYIFSQLNYEAFKKLEKKYGFQTIIFSITDQTPWGQNFLKNVINDKDWKIVYIDHFTIVLVRNSFLNESLKAIDLNKLLPENYNFDSYMQYLKLGYFLLNSGNLESAEKFVDTALYFNPDSPGANYLKAYIISKSNDYSKKSSVQKYFEKGEKSLWW